MKRLDLPGLRCMGQVSHQQVNHGQQVPLYEPIAPAGRPDINTLEGWKAGTQWQKGTTLDRLSQQMAEHQKTMQS